MALSETDFVWSESYPKESDDRLNAEVFPADQLDRGRYAWFLTNYLVEEGKKNGYVLNINASWGTGKTYFLNRWKAVLEKEYPVVYIDAWKQDYSDDPLLTVVASIISQLRSLAGNEAEDFVISAAEKAVRLFKAAAPAITKGLVKKATGVKIDEIADSWQDESSGVAKPVGDFGAGEAAGKMVEALINDHNAKLQGVDSFKESMKQWIEAIIGKQKFQFPAFIFIDELDRCRPSYAVEMLEVIKHFFEMENVVFVVATDTEQLQHAVKVVYGQGFDAQVYLSRFFKRRFTLKSPTRKSFVEQLEHITLDELNNLQVNYWPKLNEPQELLRILSCVADEFSLSLRDTEQLVERISAVLRNCSGKDVNLYFLTVLFALYDTHFDFYQKVITGYGSYKEEGDIFSHSVVSSQLKKDWGCERLDIYMTPKSSWGDTYQYIDDNKQQRHINNPTEDKYYFITMLEIIRCQHESLISQPKASDVENAAKKTAVSPEIISKNPVYGDVMTPLLMKNEIVKLTSTLHNYRDWIELATSFDD